MGNVGLLLVGVVLFVNGLVSIGVVKPRSAAPLNLFVGSAQVILPTLILVQAGGDAGIVNGTWPSLLFGFTYLWFGLIQIYDLEPQGFGWYSVFVAAIAAVYAVKNIGTDPVFAVIWATWATMWTLFFVLLGLGITRVRSFDLGHFTGWVLILLGIPTCTVPAIFLLNGVWTDSPVAGVAALAVLALAAGLSAALARRTAGTDETVPAAGPAPVEVVPAEEKVNVPQPV
ncbi:AmiS/UreI family transporter [Mycobacterium sp. 852002-51961_SCH5331710]|uniref:AmiS/UreI family transporter n=1 Tax=Mycobacterium sp. 852002-51961_SCH5331710 TaxID=1834105 RepID=UPI0008002ED0|nr:AmiS/UreI family transporter [Mycobacterium sp. 852002-51961_SCH5331710]OBB48375.1 amidase [Mycobacterium sp. 852002-51961_SCH5331710]